MAMLLLPACNGIFEDIYDQPLPQEEAEFGFIKTDNATNTGRIYIDATDYKEWHYIDLHNRSMVTVPVDGQPPAAWDFAVHRYDAKTNGAKVHESSAVSLGAVPAPGTIPEGEFVTDEWTEDRITTDMSQMMDGIILYAKDFYNPCLSKWLNVDTSTMPPIYTLSGRVYILSLPDGTYAALLLTDFMNDAAVKGFMTIDYQYPVKL